MAAAFQGDAFQSDTFESESGVNATAGIAAGTGAASGLSFSLAASIQAASGAGASLDATVSNATNTNALAEVAAGTGAASDISVIGAPTAGLGAGTGTGLAAKATVSPSSINAAGTGAVTDAAAKVSVRAAQATGTGAARAVARFAQATAAAGTGIARTPSVTVVVAPAPALGTAAALDTGLMVQAAVGSGMAHVAQVATADGSGTSVVAGAAYGVGLTDAVTMDVRSVAESATGTGAASPAKGTFATGAATATGSGAALDAVAARRAPVATGTGTGANAATSVAPTLIVAAGTGMAIDVQIALSDSTTTQAAAGVAPGAGSDLIAAALLGIAAQNAAGAGAAANITSAAKATASAAAGTGAAYVTTSITTANAYPTLASGTGRANGARRFATAIVISYNEVDITPDIDLASAIFSAQVNGGIGTCSFKVRDDGHTYSFVAGGDLTLDINGVRMWGGYLTRAARTYAFPVEDTTGGKDVTAPRYWSMSGVDYNVLFTKRIIYDPAAPTTKLSFDYPVGTYDDTIIADLFDHYLDIEDDGLTRTGVTRVDVATLDIRGVTSGKGSFIKGRSEVAQAGRVWKDSMDIISKATGAIYYIDPVKVLHYVDVDTADAAFGLSDAPGVGEKGYQSFNLTYNGTNLVNDMLVWGQALGSDTTVFSRRENTASQTAHGRWQGGLFTDGLYKQASANLVANSYLTGTPQNKRGGKDDAITLNCKVYEPVFNVGQKVATEVNIFGYTDVIPIRRQEIRFINPNEAVFSLSLGHEIDQPWSIYEDNWKMPKFPRVAYKPPPIESIDDPGGCDCGITDTFTRTVASGWGISDAGLAWATWFGTLQSVNGTGGVLGPASGASVSTGLAETNYTFDFTANFNSLGAVANRFFTFSKFLNSGYNRLFLPKPGANYYPGFVINRNGVETTLDFSAVSGVTYHIRVEEGATQGRMKMWTGSVEPAAWDMTNTEPVPANTGSHYFGFGGGLTGETLVIDNLDITDVNRCTAVQFDDFNRTGSNLGVTTSGKTWTSSSGAGYVPTTTNGSSAVQAFGANRFSENYIIYAANESPPWAGGSWIMNTTFKVTSLSATFGDIVQWKVVNSAFTFDVVLQVQLKSGSGQGHVRVTGNELVAAATTVKDDWQINTNYRVKWEYQMGVLSRAKVWVDGTTEPAGWTVEGVSDGTHAFDAGSWFLWVSEQQTAFTQTKTYDYIEFDYEGKPCYYGATGETVVFDDCNRVVAANFASVGGPSSGTQNYLRIGTGSATLSVDGSVMKVEETGFSPWPDVELWYPPLQVPPLDSAALDLLAEGCTWTTRFKPLAVMTSANGDSGSSNYLEFEFWTTGGDFGLKINIGDGTAHPGAFYPVDYGGYTLETQVSDFYYTFDGVGYDATKVNKIKTNWSANTWYTVKVKFSESPVRRAQVKLWSDSESEPDWQIEGYMDASRTWAPQSYVGIDLHTKLSAGTSFTSGFHLDDILAVTPYGPSPAGVLVQWPPRTGWFCETIIHEAGSSFAARAAFVAGTLEVMVNGLLVSTTFQNSAAGTFTLTNSIEAIDVLRICYEANGAPEV